MAQVGQDQDGLYDKRAGAESLILSPGLNSSLEPGGHISCASRQLMSMKHARQQMPVAMSDNDTFAELPAAFVPACYPSESPLSYALQHGFATALGGY